MRLPFALAALTTSVLVAGSMMVPARAGTTVETPVAEVLFNHVLPGTAADHTIDDRIREFIDGAPSGAEIRVAMYLFNDSAVEAAIVNAVKRGVVVRVAANDRKDDPPLSGWQDIENALTADEMTRFNVTYCAGTCIGPPAGPDKKPINHDKFWLFSRVRLPGESADRVNVVIDTSQNIYPGQAEEPNNAWIRSGDSALYGGYRDHFERMHRLERPGSVTTIAYGEDRDLDGQPDVKVWFSPRPTDSSGAPVDFVANDLTAENIPCSGAGAGRIRLSGSNFWVRPDLRQKLVALKNAGCDVRMALREEQESQQDNDQGELDELGAGGIPIVGYRPGGCRYVSCAPGKLHSKYLLAEWNDSTGRAHRVVYTGSHNWTRGALQSNDETLAKFAWSGAASQVGTPATAFYDAYFANFTQLWNDAIDIRPDVYGSAPATHYQVVEPDPAGDQHQSVVASNASGAMAIVWEDQENFSTANEHTTDIHLRRYLNGVAVSAPITLSGGGDPGVTSWSHVAPSVEMDDAGNAIVAWREDPDGNGSGDITVVKVTPSGDVIELARPHASGAGHQTEPSVAVNGAGDYAIAWQTVDANGRPAVVVSRYTRSGDGYTAVPGFVEKDVAPTKPSGSYSHTLPDVGMDDDGNVTVVWTSDENGNGYGDVQMIRFDSAGVQQGSAKRVTAAGTGHQTRPRIAVNGTGQAAVTWQHRETLDPPSPYQAWVRTVTADGTFAAAETRLDEDMPTASGAQARPDVAIDDSGKVVATWRENEPWTRPAGARIRGDVWARGYTFTLSSAREGADVLPAYRMNLYVANEQGYPAVAVHPVSGVVAIAYSDDYNSEAGGPNELRLRYGFPNSRP